MARGARPGDLDGATVVALGAMALGIFVVASDFTALSVAVVTVEKDLSTTLNRAQWVINAYALVFGVLIVTGGRLADLLGRRRMFVVGAAVFGAFSLLGGLAPNIELLIAARALMAVGGALMWPSALGMTYALLPEDRAGLAGGLIVGVAGLGNAIGPLLAGALIDALSWRWVFFANVPIALGAIVVTRRNVAESRVAGEVRIDYRGIAVLTLALVLVLAGLDRGSVVGVTDPVVVGMIAAGFLLLLLLAQLERSRGPDALLPRRVLRSPQFSGALASMLLLSVTFFGILLYVPQFTQKVLGWSALAAGAGLLPLLLVFAGVSFAAGTLYNRLGARLVVVVGAGGLAVGAALLGLGVGSGMGYPALLPGLAVVGVGVGLFFSTITTAAVTAVDAPDASLAGGIAYMGNMVGGSVGIGINTAIVLSAASLADGIRAVFLVDAVLAAVGAVVAVSLIRREGTSSFHPRLRRHHRAHG